MAAWADGRVGLAAVRTPVRAGRGCDTDCLAAVIDVVAEVFHFQDRGVGAAFRGLLQMGFGHLGDHHAMVAHFEHFLDGALDRRDRDVEDGAAVGRHCVSEPVDFTVFDFGGFEEGEGSAFAVFAQHVQHELAGAFDDSVRTGIGLHAGVPLALAYTKHFTFELVPELTFGYASSTIKANIVAGQPASPDISQSGLRFDLGGRVGGELHFGFMGVPQLSLQATVGLGFRYSSVKVSLSDNSFSQSSGGPSFGTSVQDAPWAIFTNNVSALYYF